MVCGVPLYSASIAEVLLTTLPGEQWEAERELQRRMVNRLYREATSKQLLRNPRARHPQWGLPGGSLGGLG